MSRCGRPRGRAGKRSLKMGHSIWTCAWSTCARTTPACRGACSLLPRSVTCDTANPHTSGWHALRGCHKALVRFLPAAHSGTPLPPASASAQACINADTATARPRHPLSWRVCRQRSRLWQTDPQSQAANDYREAPLGLWQHRLDSQRQTPRTLSQRRAAVTHKRTHISIQTRVSRYVDARFEPVFPAWPFGQTYGKFCIGLWSADLTARTNDSHCCANPAYCSSDPWRETIRPLRE